MREIHPRSGDSCSKKRAGVGIADKRLSRFQRGRRGNDLEAAMRSKDTATTSRWVASREDTTSSGDSPQGRVSLQRTKRKREPVEKEYRQRWLCRDCVQCVQITNGDSVSVKSICYSYKPRMINLYIGTDHVICCYD